MTSNDRKLTELYKDLEKYSNFSEDDNTEKFLDTVDQLVLRGDASSIGKILPYFDDNSDYDWVFESVSKAIEHFAVELYVKELLTNFHILETNAKGFACSMIYPILNNQEALFLFKKYLYLADKLFLKKVLEDIQKRSQRHKATIHDILAMLY